MYHADENWQSLEVAYDLVYGRHSRASKNNSVEMLLSWEWFEAYALRNHLYPLYLAIPTYILKFINLDY